VFCSLKLFYFSQVFINLLPALIHKNISILLPILLLCYSLFYHYQINLFALASFRQIVKFWTKLTDWLTECKNAERFLLWCGLVWGFYTKLYKSNRNVFPNLGSSLFWKVAYSSPDIPRYRLYRLAGIFIIVSTMDSSMKKSRKRHRLPELRLVLIIIPSSQSHFHHNIFWT